MTDKTEVTLYCSFCGKSQHDVRTLIAGPSVYICDECIELCQDICVEKLEHSDTTVLTEIQSLRLENRLLRSLASQALEWCNREVLMQQRALAPLVKITEELRTALRPPERPAPEGVVNMPKPD